MIFQKSIKFWPVISDNPLVGEVMDIRSRKNLVIDGQSYGLKLAVFFALLALNSCGNIALQVFGGSGTKVVGLSGAGGGAESFSSRCGAKASDLSDPSYKVVDQVMKSSFIVRGEKSDITYDATFEATITVQATSGQGSQVTDVKLANLRSDDNGRFSKPQVEAEAAKQCNTKTTKSMGTGLLLKLQKTAPEFQDVECSVGFTAMSKVENSEAIGQVIFDPGAPLALNPRASLLTYEKELGKSRTFTSLATIQLQGKDWAAVGTQAKITVTWTKVSPDIKQTKGAPAGAKSLDADLAYEVTVTAGGVDVSTFGLSKRQVFFINSANHKLVGVLDDSGRVNPSSKKPLDPVLAIVQ